MNKPDSSTDPFLEKLRTSMATPTGAVNDFHEYASGAQQKLYQAGQLGRASLSVLRTAWRAAATVGKYSGVLPVTKFAAKTYLNYFNWCAWNKNETTGLKTLSRKGAIIGVLPALLATTALVVEPVRTVVRDTSLLPFATTENLILLGPDPVHEENSEYSISASRTYPASPLDAKHLQVRPFHAVGHWISAPDAESIYDVTPPEVSFATVETVGIRAKLFFGLINIYPTVIGVSEIKTLNQLPSDDPIKIAITQHKEVFAKDFPQLPINQLHVDGNASNAVKNAISHPAP